MPHTHDYPRLCADGFRPPLFDRDDDLDQLPRKDLWTLSSGRSGTFARIRNTLRIARWLLYWTVRGKVPFTAAAPVLLRSAVLCTLAYAAPRLCVRSGIRTYVYIAIWAEIILYDKSPEMYGYTGLVSNEPTDHTTVARRASAQMVATD